MAPLYHLQRIPAHFTRIGYRVRLYEYSGKPAMRRVEVRDEGRRFMGYTVTDDPVTFFGADGRTVRAEAIRWAHNNGASCAFTPVKL